MGEPHREPASGPSQLATAGRLSKTVEMVMLMIEVLRKVIQRMHHLLEVMLMCVS